MVESGWVDGKVCEKGVKMDRKVCKIGVKKDGKVCRDVVVTV